MTGFLVFMKLKNIVEKFRFMMIMVIAFANTSQYDVRMTVDGLGRYQMMSGNWIMKPIKK